MTTPLVSRSAAGLVPPSGPYSPVSPEGITVHYGGPSPWTDATWPGRANDLTGAGHDHARCAGIWRAWQAFHMLPGSLGTVPPAHPTDIAYTSGVCPGAVRFEGRPRTTRCAANGTAEGNRRSLAVVYIAGVGDALTELAKAAFIDEQDRLGVPLRWDHRAWFPTECPGDPLHGWKLAGFPSPSVAPPAPDPVVYPPPPRPVGRVPITPHEEDQGPMARLTFDCGHLDGAGNGAVIFDGGTTGDQGITHFQAIRWADARDPNVVGSYPPADNGQHLPLPRVGWQNRGGWVALQFYGGVPGSPIVVTLDVAS